MAAFGLAGSALADSTSSRASPCWSKGGTFHIVECFSKVGAQSDVELNSLYRKITRVLGPEDLRQLQNSERLWVAYRDATCKAEKSLWNGGTGGNPAYLACVDDETQHRLDYLQTTYRLRLQKLEL
ncbi:lysozyme inhibitor LprI family protein [Novosphingobium resinovorum]|uniref:lysozyme inhibitor LprI family protein n=1 Tax=Novosphingobium resinovorum TaxID=158500 RepID=UPI003B8A6FB8